MKQKRHCRDCGWRDSRKNSFVEAIVITPKMALYYCHVHWKNVKLDDEICKKFRIECFCCAKQRVKKKCCHYKWYSKKKDCKYFNYRKWRKI